MSTMEVPPPWQDATADGEFPKHLREHSRKDDRRLFHPLDAGEFVVSLQASPFHASTPASAAPAEEITEWEMAVFTQDGRLLSEALDREIISLPKLWRQFWTDGIARHVPTSVAAVILHRFRLGPEDYDKFVLVGPD